MIRIKRIVGSFEDDVPRSLNDEALCINATRGITQRTRTNMLLVIMRDYTTSCTSVLALAGSNSEAPTNRVRCVITTLHFEYIVGPKPFNATKQCNVGHQVVTKAAWFRRNHSPLS